MQEDFITILGEHATRLARLDFYIWLKENYSEDFIPHIGEEANYSIERPKILESKEVYSVDDLALVFDCKRDKALKIMHLMERDECSMKLGKDYYTTKEKTLEFINRYMGQKVAI